MNCLGFIPKLVLLLLNHSHQLQLHELLKNFRNFRDQLHVRFPSENLLFFSPWVRAPGPMDRPPRRSRVLRRQILRVALHRPFLLDLEPALEGLRAPKDRA